MIKLGSMAGFSVEWILMSSNVLSQQTTACISHPAVLCCYSTTFKDCHGEPLKHGRIFTLAQLDAGIL